MRGTRSSYVPHYLELKTMPTPYVIVVHSIELFLDQRITLLQ